MLTWLATFATLLVIFGIVGRLLVDDTPDGDPPEWLGWEYKWRLSKMILPYAAGATVVLWAVVIVVRLT